MTSKAENRVREASPSHQAWSFGRDWKENVEQQLRPSGLMQVGEDKLRLGAAILAVAGCVGILVMTW